MTTYIVHFEGDIEVEAEDEDVALESAFSFVNEDNIFMNINYVEVNEK